MANVALPIGKPQVGNRLVDSPGAQDPNALIAEQFAKQRKSLDTQKLQAIDEMRAQQGRQQALTGMGGGSALLAQEKAQRGLENQFTAAEQDIGAKEAAAKLQESQYERSFGLEQQKFAEQQKEFQDQFGLSQQQFAEAKNQFSQQFGLATKEFDENQKTNFWNTLINISKADVPAESWNYFIDQYNSASSGNKMPVNGSSFSTSSSSQAPTYTLPAGNHGIRWDQ